MDGRPVQEKSGKIKGIIFDLDGVLVNSMPSHVQAWKSAFKDVAGIDATARDIYLLEGMRGIELITEIFERNAITNRALADAVHEEKNRTFRSIRRSEPFDGVTELLNKLRCSKAVVSGSSRSDVQTILSEAFGTNKFESIVAAEDVKKGKPDPLAFLEAIKRIHLQPSDVVVVENAPLGVRAAASAGMECVVVLNNSPLGRDDFDVADEKIFEETQSLSGHLGRICS